MLVNYLMIVSPYALSIDVQLYADTIVTVITLVRRMSCSFPTIYNNYFPLWPYIFHTIFKIK